MATVSLDEKRADSFCVWVTAETHRYRNQLVRYQPAWSGVGSGGGTNTISVLLNKISNLCHLKECIYQQICQQMSIPNALRTALAIP